MRLHPHRGRLYQAPAQGHLSGPEARRPRHFRHDPEGRGHRAGDVRGLYHDYVLFVTDKGRLFRIKGYTIAEGSRTSKGSNIVNLLQLAEGEKVTNMLCYPKDGDNKGGFVTMVTKQGLIKRTPLEQYANIRKTGLIGIALNEATRWHGPPDHRQ